MGEIAGSNRRTTGEAWRKRAALGLSAACALAMLQSAAAQQRFKASIDLVQFSVVLTDKQGTPITGLKPEDFEIVEEGKPQTITYFSQGDPEDGDNLGEVSPLHLGLTLDTSGSMERDIQDVRTAVIKFLNANNTAMDFTLVDFDTEIRVARYGAGEMERLIERIRRRKPDGWTALFDAVGVYLNGIGPLDGQKIMLLYTDGGDTRSELTFSDLLDLLKSSDVTLYAIGLMEDARNGQRPSAKAKKVLQDFADATGGAAYFPKSIEQVEELCKEIAHDLRSRYSIAYEPSNAARDGGWRDVKVGVAPSKAGSRLTVRAKPGYFAAK